MRFGTLVVAAIMALTACGGDSLTPADYFNEVAAARDTYEVRLDELDTTFTNSISAIDYQAPDAEQLLANLFRDQVSANTAAFRVFTEALAAIDPPGDFSASHDDAVAAAEAVVTVFRDREDDLNAIANLADVDAYASDSDIADRRGRFVEACNELQALADTNDIVVDLSCGS